MGSTELERTLRGLGVQSAGKLVVALSDPTRNLPGLYPPRPPVPTHGQPASPTCGDMGSWIFENFRKNKNSQILLKSGLPP